MTAARLPFVHHGQTNGVTTEQAHRSLKLEQLPNGDTQLVFLAVRQQFRDLDRLQSHRQIQDALSYGYEVGRVLKPSTECCNNERN